MRYKDALSVQESLVNSIKRARANKEESPQTLITVEHDPVYTIGVRNDAVNESERRRLESLGADFHQTNRGGLITFHGPGQLVAYPILDLTQLDMPEKAKKKSLLGMKWYVNALEQTVIDALDVGFGIKGLRSIHTGVWVDDVSKICAMGVHNSGLITSHGLALNCDVDLNWFGHIVACGLEGKKVTSITQQIGRRVSIDEAEAHLIDAFEVNFNCKVIS